MCVRWDRAKPHPKPSLSVTQRKLVKTQSPPRGQCEVIPSTKHGGPTAICCHLQLKWVGSTLPTLPGTFVRQYTAHTVLQQNLYLHNLLSISRSDLEILHVKFPALSYTAEWRLLSRERRAVQDKTYMSCHKGG